MKIELSDESIAKIIAGFKNALAENKAKPENLVGIDGLSVSINKPKGTIYQWVNKAKRIKFPYSKKLSYSGRLFPYTPHFNARVGMSSFTTPEISYGVFHLVKKPCEVCGEETTHAHHEDYSKPNIVKWLCVKHHRELHNNKTLC